MRVVVALGGNALLRRGQILTDETQRENVGIACDELAPIAIDHELVISHGNGPHVGLLALQAEAYEDVPPAPLDVLGAQTQGMIGYIVEQELGNRLPFDKPLATLLTMIEVDPTDPAFANPTKPIGPIYSSDVTSALERDKGWSFAPEGTGHRRVVASPRPKRIFELDQIRWMLEHGAVVICAGGGGIPTMYDDDGMLVGVEAVIDKDHASGLLATGLDAELFIMATGVDAVYVDFGEPTQRAIATASPDSLLEMRDDFSPGSMRPKVVAACEFAIDTGRTATIGALHDVGAMLGGEAGTIVTTKSRGISFRDD
jgi:carbamate kinase